ncbi:MAG TPA: Rieske 2Fe-2S domain-containing protein [Myxococcota bacterium]|nr:Rieske 2Fe-2S domain-containing protein [Myxococcota bacterium]
MAHRYRAVQWNPQKRRYDAVLAVGVAGYLVLFVGAGFALRPGATIETLLIRAFGSAALLLLHGILCIGPLARLDRRFLPLLYNRRHLGVVMAALALVHAALATVQFHALGDLAPWTSVLVANPRFDSVSQFPFEWLGAAALAVLLSMAATSHDFWLANLTPPVWKSLHMAVYFAYGALVLHVALGTLQSDRSLVLAGLLALGFGVVVGLHLVVGVREARADRGGPEVGDDGWVDVCAVDAIPEKRARIVRLAGERIAVFRFDGRVAAVSNVCQHQNGPLGEGRILDGCITCPWHGYQYRPETGRSPAPFTDEVPIFRVRVREGRVWLHPRPLPAGTPLEPAWIDRAPERAHG